MIAPNPRSWKTAVSTAAHAVAKFFEQQPFAYEETLDHILIHELNMRLASVPGVRLVARFGGRAGQVYFPSGGRREVIDLLLVIQTPHTLKIALFQSKRLFPKRSRLPAPPVGGTTLSDLIAYVNAELSTPTAAFKANCAYDRAGLSRAGAKDAQWQAIETINRLSRACTGFNAIYYLLYNPLDPAIFGFATAPSGGQIGVRIVSQDALGSAIMGSKGASFCVSDMASIFALTDSELTNFLGNAVDCKAGIPIDKLSDEVRLLLPAIAYRTGFDERMPYELRSETKATLDLRNTTTVVLSLSEAALKEATN